MEEVENIIIEEGLNDSQNKETTNKQDGQNPPIKEKREVQDQETDWDGTLNFPQDGAPYVVFVGPPSSGKSMALKRLASYLRTENYTVTANRDFINTKEYRNRCEDFDYNLRAVGAALENTEDYLLVDIKRGGISEYHFLEAPGEHYFAVDDYKEEVRGRRAFQMYINELGNAKSPKIFVILLDLDTPYGNGIGTFRANAIARGLYIEKMKNLYDTYVKPMPNNRVILLYNKIDIPGFAGFTPLSKGNEKGEPLKDAKREDRYGKLFSHCMRKVLFWDFEDYSFLTFCSGVYGTAEERGRENGAWYTESNDIYPRDLWREINKSNRRGCL